MNLRPLLAATATVITLFVAQGCAVTRGQEPVGAYVDDSVITTDIKARFAANPEVDATWPGK